MVVMRVIIVGAGEVGFQIAKFLITENVDVVVIDKSKEKIKRISAELDVAVVEGQGGSPSVLKEAGAEEADILLAVTDMDESNMISCLVAKVMFQVPQNIARIRNLEYFGNRLLLKSLGIDPAISPEIEAAKAVIRLLEAPFAADVEDFEDGKVKVIGFKVPSDSKLIGKALKDLDLKSPKVLIGAIQRGDRMIIPVGSDVIKQDDIIYMPAKTVSVDLVCNSIGAVTRPVKKMMIVGGGRVGYYVAKTMEERGVSVKVIEKDAERCKFLLNSLKNSLVLHGDGSDQKLLEEENIADMDIFAAISNNEELNIMASLLAKRLGVRKVITIVNKTDYLPLAGNIGIESVLSPRLITADTILKYVRGANILSLTTIADGKAEIMEAEVSESSAFVGKSLAEVEMPKKSLIGIIIRGEDIIIPSGDDRILAKDKLVIFTLEDSIRKVEELLK
jgi:trk system potassium uptake protein TrkA